MPEDRARFNIFDSDVLVEVDVTNTSGRAGSDVIEVYVEPPKSLLHRRYANSKDLRK